MINPAYISSIIMKENKYTVKMLHFDIKGSMLFGSGGISSDNTIMICNETQPQDYAVMKRWIDQVTK